VSVFFVRYTCSLHHALNKTYSVDVPWEETTEIPLTTEAVWSLVNSDKALLEELFGADFASYEDMSKFPAHYGHYLRRVNETIYLKIDAPKESFEENPAPVGVRRSLKRSVKNLLRRNLLRKGTDIPASTSTTIVRAYTKD
jgi:hypothetical protein